MGTIRKMPILCLLGSLLLSMPAAAGEADEADMDILLGTIQANKKALVAVNMELEDAEAKAFWPVYDRYDAELSDVRNRFLALVKDYTANFSTMNDEKAEQIAGDYLALEQERTQIRQAYLEPFSTALPGRKVVRFYQIENKMHAVVRYNLARDIPVIEQR